MAGLPNSSNALQQWHRLFETQGQSRSEQAQQHLQQMLGRELLMAAGQRQRLGGLNGLFGAVGIEVEIHG